uniref:Uncharacterized protein n=1 Tax=Physcomitrium patens TaxID=3218 RepID=A0A2K1J3A4_PHYPA|nr:hypothetical protein PHYPA_021850 [Physcomitrium patens]
MVDASGLFVVSIIAKHAKEVNQCASATKKNVDITAGGEPGAVHQVEQYIKRLQEHIIMAESTYKLLVKELPTSGMRLRSFWLSQAKAPPPPQHQ